MSENIIQDNKAFVKFAEGGSSQLYREKLGSLASLFPRASQFFKSGQFHEFAPLVSPGEGTEPPPGGVGSVPRNPLRGG